VRIWIIMRLIDGGSNCSTVGEYDSQIYWGLCSQSVLDRDKCLLSAFVRA
jgi:hypothetical protein